LPVLVVDPKGVYIVSLLATKEQEYDYERPTVPARRHEVVATLGMVNSVGKIIWIVQLLCKALSRVMENVKSL
jgi:hypothetical protein